MLGEWKFVDFCVCWYKDATIREVKISSVDFPPTLCGTNNTQQIPTLPARRRQFDGAFYRFGRKIEILLSIRFVAVLDSTQVVAKSQFIPEQIIRVTNFYRTTIDPEIRLIEYTATTPPKFGCSLT